MPWNNHVSPDGIDCLIMLAGNLICYGAGWWQSRVEANRRVAQVMGHSYRMGLKDGETNRHMGIPEQISSRPISWDGVTGTGQMPPSGEGEPRC